MLISFSEIAEHIPLSPLLQSFCWKEYLFWLKPMICHPAYAQYFRNIFKNQLTWGKRFGFFGFGFGLAATYALRQRLDMPTRPATTTPNNFATCHKTFGISRCCCGV